MIVMKQTINTATMNEKPPTWAARLEQAWTQVQHLQTRDSSKLSHVSMYALLPDLVWEGLDFLPRGPPKPPYIAQA
jgi:hypothetical protein